MSNNPWIEAIAQVESAVEAGLKKTKFKAKGLKITSYIEEPPHRKMGDLACSISFPIGKKMRKSPREIAEKLLSVVKTPPLFSKVALAGAYVNFFLDPGKFAQHVIQAVDAGNFGQGEKKKDRIMIEYSQPNPFKGFHIGHVRNTVLGDSLRRMLALSGYEVIPVNYYNDLGAHVAKGLWNYLNFYKGKEPATHRGQWLGKIYAEAVKKVEADPKNKETTDELLQTLEAHSDPALDVAWKQCRDWSVSDFKNAYQELDAKFDYDFYESDLTVRAHELVKELQKKKVAKKSKGAILVNLEKEKLGVFLLLRADGTLLYSAKDVALAEEKFKKYKVNRSLYVVGSEQRLYFRQLFRVLSLMGFKQAKKCMHLSYELVTLKEGKMSSREGTAIPYTELRDRMLQRAMEEVIARHPELHVEEQRKIASIVALGALKFDMINTSPSKAIFFDWASALQLEGETAPYIQYAAVRAARILEKVKKKTPLSKVSFDSLVSEEEHALVKVLAHFPLVVSEAAEAYKPHLVSDYVFHVAEVFNRFYNEHPVIKASNVAEKNARIALVLATKTILEQGLDLLGIKVPPLM